MYNNLRAEMTRHNVSAQTVADLLGKTVKTVRDKLTGRSDFTLGEIVAIRADLFPDLSLDYLAEKTETVEETDPPDAAG